VSHLPGQRSTSRTLSCCYILLVKAAECASSLHNYKLASFFYTKHKTHGQQHKSTHSLTQADLAKMLHDVREAEVRSAVGEAVALVVHCCGLGDLCVQEANSQGGGEGVESEDEEAEDFRGKKYVHSNGEGVRNGREHEDGSGEEGGLGSVVGRMRELAMVGKKRTDDLRHGRRAKAEMRSAFRSVLAVVEQSQVCDV